MFFMQFGRAGSGAKEWLEQRKIIVGLNGFIQELLSNIGVV
jgi:hypothetical protein